MTTEYDEFCRQTNELGKKLKGEYGKDFTLDDLQHFAEFNSKSTLIRASAYQAEKAEKGEDLDKLYEYQFIVNSANEFANIMTADSMIYELIKAEAEKNAKSEIYPDRIIFTPRGPLFLIGTKKKFDAEYMGAGMLYAQHFFNTKKHANAMIEDVAAPFLNGNKFYSIAASKDLCFRLNSVVIGKRYRYDKSKGKAAFEPATDDVEKEIVAEKSLYLQSNGRMRELIHNITKE